MPSLVVVLLADNYFYPAWAYVFPTTVLRLPYSLLLATLWSCVVYYPTGLAPEASRSVSQQNAAHHNTHGLPCVSSCGLAGRAPVAQQQSVAVHHRLVCHVGW